MEPNPYESPKEIEEPLPERKRWSFGRKVTLLICLSFALVGCTMVLFWRDYSVAAYACILLGALGALCTLAPVGA